MNNFTEQKIYKILHSRKGLFIGKVISQSEEWVEVEIVSGKAKAILEYNERGVGEKIQLRKSFISSIEEV